MSDNRSVDNAERLKGEWQGDAALARPGEFYFEGPYMVFTAAYHLRRGYCCNSDCRHCPYK